MNNLLKFEFRKLKRQKSFYICLIIMAVMLFITGITYKVLMDHAAELAEITGESLIPTTFPMFLLSFASASMFSMISSIYVSIATCEDYESRIIKNIYGRGYSRTAHYFSKLIYIAVATTIMFLIVVALAVGVGGAFFGFEGLNGRVFTLVLGQYVVCMSGVALSFAIATLIKKLGGTIAANILVPMILPLLLELADTALESESFKFADLWIDSFLTSLTNTEVGTGRMTACILGAMAYGVVFIVAGYFANKKTEV